MYKIENNGEEIDGGNAENGIPRSKNANGGGGNASESIWIDNQLACIQPVRNYPIELVYSPAPEKGLEH